MIRIKVMVLLMIKLNIICIDHRKTEPGVTGNHQLTSQNSPEIQPESDNLKLENSNKVVIYPEDGKEVVVEKKEKGDEEEKEEEKEVVVEEKEKGDEEEEVAVEEKEKGDEEEEESVEEEDEDEDKADIEYAPDQLKQLIDLLFLFDISGSMDGYIGDISHATAKLNNGTQNTCYIEKFANRKSIELGKQLVFDTLTNFISKNCLNRVGFIAFDDKVYNIVPFKRKVTYINMIDKVEGLVTQGCTSLYDGIAYSMEKLKGSLNAKLVIITDGLDNGQTESNLYNKSRFSNLIDIFDLRNTLKTCVLSVSSTTDLEEKKELAKFYKNIEECVNATYFDVVSKDANYSSSSTSPGYAIASPVFDINDMFAELDAPANVHPIRDGCGAVYAEYINDDISRQEKRFQVLDNMINSSPIIEPSWMANNECVVKGKENCIRNDLLSNSITDAYYKVESDATLNGSFLCKVLIKEFSSKITSKEHMFGLMKVDKVKIFDNFVNNSVLISSEGELLFFNKEGSGKIVCKKWKQEDTLILGRGDDNKVYFSINGDREYYLGDVSGPVKVVMSFLIGPDSIRKQDEFHIIYLKKSNNDNV